MRTVSLALIASVLAAAACTDASTAPRGGPPLATGVTAELAGTVGTSNAPTGLRTISDRDFRIRARSWSDTSGIAGWDPATEDASRLGIATITGAPRSPSNAARFAFAAGSRGGEVSSRGSTIHYLNRAPWRTLYASVWVQLSADWRGPASGRTTLLQLGLGDWTRLRVGVKGTGTGVLVPTVWHADAPDGRPELVSNATPRAAARGTWQRWELITTLNDASARNGHVVLYLDGVKVMDYADVPLLHASDTRKTWSYVLLRPDWGTSADAAPVAMSLLVDHAILGGAEQRVLPGAGTPPPPADTTPTTPPDTTRVVGSVTVVPDSATVAVGRTVSLRAVVRDTRGDSMSFRPVTWRAIDTSAVVVDQSGLVTGRRVGGSSVIALREGFADTAHVRVQAVPVATVTVSPATATLLVGGTTQLTATLRDADNAVLRDRAITWTSMNTAVATVSATGIVTAVSAGSVSVQAAAEGRAASAAITVTAPTPPPTGGSCPAPTIVSHGFDDGTEGPLDNWDNTPIVQDPTATGGWALRKQWIYGPEQGAGVGYNFASSPSTARKSLYVRFRYKQDATFDNSGAKKLVRFHGPNYSGIYGTLGIQWDQFQWDWGGVDGLDTYRRINVGADVRPDDLRGQWHTYEIWSDISQSGNLRMKLWIDGTLKMDHVGPYPNPNATTGYEGLYGSVIWHWTFNAPATNGVSWSDEMAISSQCIGVPGGGGVTPPPPPPPAPAPVASVVVTPSSVTLDPAATRQLSATTRDASGATLTGRSITWASSNPSVASVSASGLVTALNAGLATINATSEGRVGSATITVNQPPPPPPPPSGGGAATNECATPRTGWIFCDDFEQDRLGSYFEYNSEGGRFARSTGVGRSGSQGMRARWGAGEVSAGDLSLSFGRNPSSYMRPADAGTANYRDVYWRFYLRNQTGWRGGAGWKLSRVMIIANASWAQALIAHVAGYEDDYLYLSGHSGTDAAGTLRTTQYNDFANFRSFGDVRGTTPLFNSANVGQWQCIEGHVRLNDAGQANGVFEFWRNDQLEARQAGLNMVGSYNAYGINSLFINNYNNSGSPQAQERYFDNLVVSTQRIGC